MKEAKVRGFEPVKEELLKNTYVEDDREPVDRVLLPLRGTKTSAGYDFYATKDLIIKPQEKVMFWTDVKAKMPEGEVLLGFIRSSMGIKNDLMMSNTVAVIDSDYYGNEKNDGNIGISIRNMKPAIGLTGIVNEFELESGDRICMPEIADLTVENTVLIRAGERVAQFIFVEFKESENCNSDVERKGGIGSTSK